MNRKGHYTRALEEAIQTHSSQWPHAWNGKNPLHGGGSFNKMTQEARVRVDRSCWTIRRSLIIRAQLTLLKALVIWSLESSEAVKATIKESYKQARHDDDLNQPLSVQAWGRDGDKRRFWLIEGQDDTHFRLYRESNPALKNVTWRSVAGTIDEVKEVAQRLDEENTQASRRLRDRINAAIPRFEASEEVSPSDGNPRNSTITATKIFQKRRRRDYRLARKAQFVRPEPGFSLYEGRTRGKRPRYTYSDEEDGGSDALSVRRSHRQSGISTPAELSGPTFTASGRQVKSRYGGTYGETMLSGQQDGTEHPRTGEIDPGEDDENAPRSRGRPRRAAQQYRAKAKAFSRKHTEGYDSLESMDDESDATSTGNEWDGGDEDEPDDNIDDEDEDEDIDMSDALEAEEEEDNLRRSLVVSLRYIKRPSSLAGQATRHGPAVSQDHGISPATISNFKGPSETHHSTDGLNETIQDAAPTHHPRPAQQSTPLHHAPPLTAHLASAEYTTLTAPKPHVSHSTRGTPIDPPEKDHILLHQDYSRPEERSTPRVSWPNPETGVLASNGNQM